MNEFMQLAVVAFKYLAALVITLMAFRAAYDRSKGGDLKSLIVGFLTFVGVFWAFIVLFPVLFNIGFSRVYTQVESSPHVDNLTKLAGAGVQLVMANPQSVSLEVPAVGSVTEEVSNALNLPAITTGNAAKPLYGEPAPVKVAPVAPAALPTAKPAGNVTGPLNTEYFHPAPNAPNIPDLQEWIMPAAVPTPVGADLPNASGGMAGPGETIDQYKARTGDGGGPQTYTVQRGDSMGKIANQFGVSLNALCNANISVTRNNCNVIRSGWVLVIP
jgi:LysM repeat protein